MRLISLDVDGPLHPVSAIAGLSLELGGFGLDKEISERNLFRWRHHLVGALAAHPDVMLAVHSSWRKYASNSALRNYLGDDLAERLVGVTSIDLPRQCGIEDLARRAGVKDLLVIDDDRDAFADAFPDLLLVDPETGISELSVQRRIATWLEETGA